MAPILDVRLLERLERVLEQQGEEILARLPDGLPETEVRAALDAIGLVPSPEILSWWGRHDGWRDQSRFEVLPGLQSLSLDEALKAYGALRRAALRTAQDPQAPQELRSADTIFHESWLPIFTTGAPPTIVIDCFEAADGGSALRDVDPREVGQPDHAEVVASSLGELVEDAVTVLERGTYRYQPAHELWMPMTWNDSYIKDRFKQA